MHLYHESCQIKKDLPEMNSLIVSPLFGHFFFFLSPWQQGLPWQRF